MANLQKMIFRSYFEVHETTSRNSFSVWLIGAYFYHFFAPRIFCVAYSSSARKFAKLARFATLLPAQCGWLDGWIQKRPLFLPRFFFSCSYFIKKKLQWREEEEHVGHDFQLEQLLVLLVFGDLVGWREKLLRLPFEINRIRKNRG